MKEVEVEGIFALANIPVLAKWELPNGYSRDYVKWLGPWWLVKTPYGNIMIGHRKRVTNIDWEDTGLEAHDLTADEVTKERFYVHAYTNAKVVEYLTELKKRLRTRDPEAHKKLCWAAELIAKYPEQKNDILTRGCDVNTCKLCYGECHVIVGDRLVLSSKGSVEIP